MCRERERRGARTVGFGSICFDAYERTDGINHLYKRTVLICKLGANGGGRQSDVEEKKKKRK